MKLTMLVCCHKQDIVATEAPYVPIHVGKAISNVELDMLRDDTGDNMSTKNQSYCELTGLYWAWKNLKDTDYIGLCHYRRYFDFHGQGKCGFPHTVLPTKDFDGIDLSIPKRVEKQLEAGAVILPKPINYECSLYIDYCRVHISDDMRTLEETVKETQDRHFVRAFKQVMHGSHKLKHYNMFIMSWSEFDRYCSWLFPLLAEVERRTDISHYNPVQRRIYGYMAERLFNVYVHARKLHVRTYPVLWFTDGKHRQRFWRTQIGRVLNNISFRTFRLMRH